MRGLDALRPDRRSTGARADDRRVALRARAAARSHRAGCRAVPRPGARTLPARRPPPLALRGPCRGTAGLYVNVLLGYKISRNLMLVKVASISGP